jgi:hypothetical protein
MCTCFCVFGSSPLLPFTLPSDWCTTFICGTVERSQGWQEARYLQAPPFWSLCSTYISTVGVICSSWSIRFNTLCKHSLKLRTFCLMSVNSVLYSSTLIVGLFSSLTSCLSPVIPARLSSAYVFAEFLNVFIVFFVRIYFLILFYLFFV